MVICGSYNYYLHVIHLHRPVACVSLKYYIIIYQTMVLENMV